MTDVRTSVVVITRDRREQVVRTLARLAELPERPPVVLVDNASSDGTADLVRRLFPHVHVVSLWDNRGALARTVGVQAATSPYVAFSDDDSWWAPGALSAAADHFDAAPRLGLLAARIVVEPVGAGGPGLRADGAEPAAAGGRPPRPLGAGLRRLRVRGAAAGLPAGRRVPPGDLLRRRGDRPRPRPRGGRLGPRLRGRRHGAPPARAGRRAQRTPAGCRRATRCCRPGCAVRPAGRSATQPRSYAALPSRSCAAPSSTHVRRLPAAVADRRPVPRHLEAQLRLLEVGRG